jgi:hypothetical protein
LVGKNDESRESGTDCAGHWLTFLQFGKTHPIIGFIVASLFFMQPFFGFIHHRIYLKVRKSTWWGVAHVWLGRLILLLGIINGGLGLQAADNTVGGEIAYGVVAGVSFLAYLGVSAVIMYKKHHMRETPTTQANKV